MPYKYDNGSQECTVSEPGKCFIHRYRRHLTDIKLLFHAPLDLSFVLISLAIPIFMVIGGPWAEKPTLKCLQILCVVSCSCQLLFFLAWFDIIRLPSSSSKLWDNLNPVWRAFLQRVFLFTTCLPLFSYIAFYYIGFFKLD